jgi:hypothetical protein
MGFMPRTRKDKYFHQRVVDYILVGGASCPGIGGLNTFINYVLEYFDTELPP